MKDTGSRVKYECRIKKTFYKIKKLKKEIKQNIILRFKLYKINGKLTDRFFKNLSRLVTAEQDRLKKIKENQRKQKAHETRKREQEFRKKQRREAHETRKREHELRKKQRRKERLNTIAFVRTLKQKESKTREDLDLIKELDTKLKHKN